MSASTSTSGKTSIKSIKLYGEEVKEQDFERQNSKSDSMIHMNNYL